MVKELEISQRFKKYNDTARKFLKQDYEKNIGPYKELIKIVMKANDIETIPAVLKLSETNTYKDNPMGAMMFMAAAVDVIEEKENLKP